MAQQELIVNMHNNGTGYRSSKKQICISDSWRKKAEEKMYMVKE